LGVVRVDEGKSFVMADIPGIIEGASDGAGLGHEFLRHVERCRMLIHVIDVSGSEGRDPIDDFNKINNELSSFSAELATRKQIVVANKCDLTDEETLASVRKYFEDNGYEYFECMAAIAEGTTDVINYVAAQLDKLPPVLRYEAEPAPVEDFTVVNKREFTLNAQDGIFVIEAKWLLKILETVDPDDYESLQYFQRVLHSSGIIDALEKAGVKEGDVVSVYDIEFNYVP
jgi:GTP-binding protein